MTERVVNTANKAASERRFGPDSLFFKDRHETGPVSVMLKGGYSLPMETLLPLEVHESQKAGEPAKEKMVAVSTTGELPATVDVVREGTIYSVDTVGEQGEHKLTKLDEFGNKPTIVDVGDNKVAVSFQPHRNLLEVHPATQGIPTDVQLTFNS